MSAIHTLVIACGNPLRGDDALGPEAAEVVRSWQAPGVKVIAVHQLVPELIEEMKPAERVLFIDAALADGDAAFRVNAVGPKQTSRLLGHHEAPANLLALLRDLEQCSPEAWLVTIPGHSFEIGEPMSEPARVQMRAALQWIHGFLAELPCTKSH